MKNHLLLLICLFISLIAFSQEEEYYMDMDVPDEIKLEGIEKYSLIKEQKSGSFYHYKLIDHTDFSVILPAIINRYYYLGPNKHLFELDADILICDDNMKQIKSFSASYMKNSGVDGAYFIDKKGNNYFLDDKLNFVLLKPALTGEFAKLGPEYDNMSLYSFGYESSNENYLGLRISIGYDHSIYCIYSPKTNQIVSKSIYQSIVRVGEYFYCLKNYQTKETEILDKNFNVVKSFSYLKTVNSNVSIVKNVNNQFGSMDKNLNVVVPLEYDSIYYKPLNEYRFNDASNQDISEEYYNEMNTPILSLYCIKDGRVELRNSFGEIRVKGVFEEIQPLNKVYYKVKLNGKYGIIDSLGEELVPIQFDKIVPFEGDFYIRLNDKWNVFSSKSKKLIEVGAQDFEILNNQVAILTKNGKKAVIGKETDQTKLIFEYDNCLVGGFKQVIVQKGKKWGVYSFRFNENKLSLPVIYDEIVLQESSIMIVKLKNQYGVFANNQMTIPCTYESIYYTLVGDNYETPYIMYCKKGNDYEIVPIHNENMWGM